MLKMLKSLVGDYAQTLEMDFNNIFKLTECQKDMLDESLNEFAVAEAQKREARLRVLGPIISDWAKKWINYWEQQVPSENKTSGFNQPSQEKWASKVASQEFGIFEENVICPICQNEEIGPMMTIDKCKCVFHVCCIKAWTEAKIEGGDFQEIYCPTNKCIKKQVLLSDMDLQKCLDFVQLQKLYEFQRLKMLESFVDYCQNPKCQDVFYLDEDDKKENVKCHKCNFCVTCGVLYHEGETCPQYIQRTGGNKTDAQMEELIKAKGWKKCPKCKQIIARDRGCIEMHCPCGIVFCYRCDNEVSACTCLNEKYRSKGSNVNIHDAKFREFWMQNLNMEVEEVVKIYESGQAADIAKIKRACGGQSQQQLMENQLKSPEQVSDWWSVIRKDLKK